MNGEVIGVNTMKVNVAGISFAIPIDTVVQVVKQLKQNKKVIRPYIGMKMANFSRIIDNNNNSGSDGNGSYHFGSWLGKKLTNGATKKERSIQGNESTLVVVLDVSNFVLLDRCSVVL